jgi:protein-tyrosine phosphatase
MIDLHLHLLPAIDDGPADLEYALAMAAALVEAGVTTAAVTPHVRSDLGWNYRRDKIVAALAQLRSAIAQRGLALELVPGGEHFLDENLPGLVEAGTATPINLGRYLLVELSTSALPPDLPAALYRLRRLGAEPLIAHVERYDALNADPALRTALVEQGYLMQVDAGALTGWFGPDQKRAAWRLVEQVPRLLVASDAHGVEDVRGTIRAAADLLRRKLGAERAQQLLVDHPAAVLASRPLDGAS